jgi:tetratricopeptide (TPR) repeat protein
MDLQGRSVALYGRFSAGVRDRLQRDVGRAGGTVARDLTRRSDVLVVGALAASLIDSGALLIRLGGARGRGVPIFGERAFLAELAGEPAPATTLPLAAALSQTLLSPDDAGLLAAFDLIALADGSCRFGDAGVVRTADELKRLGRSDAEVMRILMRARDVAPLGRHKIVLTPSGEAALQWQDGLTTLEGQGVLPLGDEDHGSVEGMFDDAALAEADGDFDEAARLYDLSARADRADAIAPYNLANIYLAQGLNDEAALAYQQALSRDAGFVEARYNLAQALEAAGKMDTAADELGLVLQTDPKHPDALFNLAQLRMTAGNMSGAKELYERYLALDPPDAWAATARKAIIYCAVNL